MMPATFTIPEIGGVASYPPSMLPLVADAHSLVAPQLQTPREADHLRGAPVSKPRSTSHAATQ
jgi:hypothetical protein